MLKRGLFCLIEENQFLRGVFGMKKTLYLMRHGQTFSNAGLKVSKEKEFMLTDLGVLQAKQVGVYFKSKNIDHCYASTLQRTQDTLRYVMGKDVEFQSLAGLDEMQFGTGESRKDVCERMKRVCTEIMEKEDHQVVLAVSHAGASYCFLRNWVEKKELKKHRQDGIQNTIIFKYEYENQVFKLTEIVRP